jgi:hypothetical protein
MRTGIWAARPISRSNRPRPPSKFWSTKSLVSRLIRFDAALRAITSNIGRENANALCRLNYHQTTTSDLQQPPQKSRIPLRSLSFSLPQLTRRVREIANPKASSNNSNSNNMSNVSIDHAETTTKNQLGRPKAFSSPLSKNVSRKSTTP